MSRTVPSVLTQNPGSIVTSALWNSGPKAIGDYFTGVPMFRGQQTSFQTAPNNTWWSVSMQSNIVDTDGGHSTSVNNTRYTCQVAGWYYVKGSTSWTTVGVQSRIDAVIAKNNGPINGSHEALVKPNADFSGIFAEVFVYLKVGDYVELWGMQNTGGSLNTTIAGDLRPQLTVLWIHG